MSWLRVILVILSLMVLLDRGSSTEGGCVPSSCGKISNIRYPFRLKEDPHGCGDSRYELGCENNVTTLYLYSAKYYVETINYNNFTIRVVDPGLQKSNCSSMPLNFLSRSNFCNTYETFYYNKNCKEPYNPSAYRDMFQEDIFEHVVYMNCSHKVTNNSKYVETSSCVNWHSPGYIYAIAVDLIAEDFEVGCHVKFVAPTSWLNFSDYDKHFNYDAMHKALVYGFEISWIHLSCKNYCGTTDPQSCYFNTTSQKLQCVHFCYHFPGDENYSCGIWSQVLLYIKGSSDQKRGCVPSFCGKISNISYPFRLKEDPHGCGDSRYELTCENNVTTLYLYSSKYHVESINYNNFTIRVVDPGLQKSNCSSMPLNFLSRSNFCDTYEDEDFNGCTDPYHAIAVPQGFLFQHIVYMNCSDKVTNNPKYVETSTCLNWNSKGYIYAIAGDLFAENYEIGCHVKFVAPTSFSGFSPYEDEPSNYDVMHIALLFGFEISWMHFSCENYCGTSNPQFCSFNTTTRKFQCHRSCFHFPGYENYPCGIWTQLRSYVKGNFIAIWIGLLQLIRGLIHEQEPDKYRVGLTIGMIGLPLFLVARFLLGMTLFIALLIHKWRRRHFSMYENIEVYLQQQNNMSSIAYTYKEIKKMGRGFREKLGEGGFGSVFKGYLRSGPCVAIKMLGKSKGNGQDFINEVATIGRIHHLNVVKLIGFCVEGSKRALVYEFMPNGSLDKVLFSKEGSINLSYDKIYNISIGVARGIAYLHHGCEMKILHFDIKPHNILLDENFIPKVSDFGLAKLYRVDNSIVTMTAARGTIGYMAPELFYKNIGGVSYKADVYSFGMLLMEMASKRRNLRTHVEHSSQIFFPLWIYGQLEKKEEVETEENVTEEEKKIVKKMIIVALWCIQLKPDDRPSMRKVVEMLEGEVESLEMPPKPTLYPHETFAKDISTNSDTTMSSEFISSHYSMEIAYDPLINNVA